MTTALEVIDALRQANMKVTIHDMGRSNYVDFVLAVIIDETIDIWYAAKCLESLNVMPSVTGNILFFPELKLGPIEYQYICNAY
jgi:hypothetical protein